MSDFHDKLRVTLKSGEIISREVMKLCGGVYIGPDCSGMVTMNSGYFIPWWNGLSDQDEYWDDLEQFLEKHFSARGRAEINEKRITEAKAAAAAIAAAEAIQEKI